MAKTGPARDVTSYTIRGTNKVIKAGDCVTMRPSEKNSLPYVASVLKIEVVKRNSVRFHIRWYYRPEESFGGRREFHGAKELFLSDHYDIQSADTIEGKCTVHSFEKYTQLEHLKNDDYYCRFEYLVSSREYLPNQVEVYCTCEQPYNPDTLMIQCEECEEWYHPHCVGMTIELVKQLDRFVCPAHPPTKKPISTLLPNGDAESKPSKM